MNHTFKKLLWAILPIALFAGIFILNMLVFSNDEQGAALYKTHCQSCHLEEGQGLRGIIPPLAQADYLLDNQNKIACIIRNGIEAPLVVNGKTYVQPMSGNPDLTDTEIANIINYINKQWGNDIPERSLQQIRIDLKECP